MNNLLILGSSYLLPNNKEWSSNLSNYNLEFGNYGDWNSLTTKGNEIQSMLLVFFLEDFFSNNNDYINIKSIEKTLRPLIILLENRLKKYQNPIIACVSSGKDFDVIRQAKGKNLLNTSLNWVMREFEVLSQKYESFYIINLIEAFGKIGNYNAFDNRNWYFARCRLSVLGIKEIAQNTNKILNRHYTAPSKVLALDCDNTLWGGVIGEDELDGIILGQDGIGQAFVDFQKEVKSLINQGIIIVLLSKNNENEVWEVFEKHKNMIIKKTDVVSWKINWKEKSQNIKELSSELDLSLDSFVFWDDNPIERDKMKTMVKEVDTVDVPKEVFEWKNLLKSYFSFSKFKITEDDKNKTNLYHKRANFVRDSKNTDDELTYLKSIKLSPSIQYFDQSNISRAEQLCLKTNQFNLRSKRFSADQLMSMSNNNKGLCFLVSLNDIYGEHGIIGLLCIQRLDKKIAYLNTFLMSCRVFGRHLEAWMLKKALFICHELGIETLLGSFISTERNTVANTFFVDHGFSVININTLKTDMLNKIGIIDKNEKFYKISTSIKKIPFEELYD